MRRQARRISSLRLALGCNRRQLLLDDRRTFLLGNRAVGSKKTRHRWYSFGAHGHEIIYCR